MQRICDTTNIQAQYGLAVETWQLAASSPTYQGCPAEPGRAAERSRSPALSHYDSILAHKQEEAGVITENIVTKQKNKKQRRLPGIC